MSDNDQKPSEPAPAPTAPTKAPSTPPPTPEPNYFKQVSWHSDHTDSLFQHLNSMVGPLNVALGGKYEPVSLASDVLTVSSSVYGQKNGTPLATAGAKLVLDVTYDRMSTGVALSAGASAEAFTAGLAAGLYGTELGVPLGPAAPLVGLAVGVGTYVVLSSEGTRREFEDTSRSAAASVATSVVRTYGEATQRAGEAVYDLERNIRNLYTTAPY